MLYNKPIGKDGIVKQAFFPEVSPHVEYSLRDIGEVMTLSFFRGENGGIEYKDMVSGI